MKKTNLNININRDDSNNNDFLVVFNSMQCMPSRVIIHDRFSGKEFNEIVKKNITGENLEENFLTEYLPSDNEYIINEKVLRQISDDLWLSYVEVNKQSENFLVNEVCIWYKNITQQKSFESLIVDFSDCIVDYEEDTTNKINTISLFNNSLELEPIFFSESDDDIDLKYNDSTIRKINKVVKSIKKKDKGLSVFCGERGIGKTNASKYIASKVDRMSIFIPNNMIDQTINNPDFKSFLKKFEKCLIIIDDCEFLYSSYNKNNYFTNNIIQLIDGFYADTLKIQFLLIFNTLEDEIDEQLLDSNNLQEVIEFDTLDSEKSTELSKNLGFNKKYKEDSKLVDIYNNRKIEYKEKIGLK